MCRFELRRRLLHASLTYLIYSAWRRDWAGGYRSGGSGIAGSGRSFWAQLKRQRKALAGPRWRRANDPLPADTMEACLSRRARCCWGRWAIRVSTGIRDICGLKPDCCGCARNWERMRICVRRFSFRRSKIIAAASGGCARYGHHASCGNCWVGLYFGQPRSIEGEPGSRWR